MQPSRSDIIRISLISAAILAISYIAFSENSTLIPSVSKSAVYCFIKAFFGSVNIRTKSSTVRDRLIRHEWEIFLEALESNRKVLTYEMHQQR